MNLRVSIVLLLVAVLLLPISMPVHPAKVTLSSDNWGLAEGEACIDCHRKSSSGLTHQWQESAHAQAKVNCYDCHQADSAEDDAIEHEGSVIATIVSPKDCGRCHEKEYQESEGSVHSKALLSIEQSVPAIAQDMTGSEMAAAGCAHCHGSRVRVGGDGRLDSSSWPNTGIGRINPDGSRGSCSACHGRHRFSKAQAREPEACIRCHTGSESPDGEIYATSKHGALYDSRREEMNLDSDQWVAGKDYSAAPTCVTCHMGASPGLKGSHDVGMRDAWSLNGPVSHKQYLVIFQDGDRMELPASDTAPRRGAQLLKADGTSGKVKAVATPKRRRQAMSKVCLECHSKGYAKGFMAQFDRLVKQYNEHYGEPSQAIMSALYERDLLTPVPFDEPLEFTYWRLWHDAGTRARHGAAMGSPDVTWWQGMHQVSRIFYGEFLPQVKEVAGKGVAQELIAEYVTSLEPHSWLNGAGRPSALLGYGIGKPVDE